MNKDILITSSFRMRSNFFCGIVSKKMKNNIFFYEIFNENYKENKNIKIDYKTKQKDLIHSSNPDYLFKDFEKFKYSTSNQTGIIKKYTNNYKKIIQNNTNLKIGRVILSQVRALHFYDKINKDNDFLNIVLYRDFLSTFNSILNQLSIGNNYFIIQYLRFFNLDENVSLDDLFYKYFTYHYDSYLKIHNQKPDIFIDFNNLARNDKNYSKIINSKLKKIFKRNIDLKLNKKNKINFFYLSDNLIKKIVKYNNINQKKFEDKTMGEKIINDILKVNQTNNSIYNINLKLNKFFFKKIIKNHTQNFELLNGFKKLAENKNCKINQLEIKINNLKLTFYTLTIFFMLVIIFIVYI